MDEGCIKPKIKKEMSLLEIKNLNISYKTRKETIVASSNVNLTLERGEILGIVGESGSGKSTLLRKICGLEGNDSGVSRDVAYVAQQPTLVMDTVAMELQLPFMVQDGLPNAGKRFAEICGLEEKEKQRTESLSGGEKQRLVFLRALAMNRKILILDEFTSELDGLSIEKIEQEVLDFKQRGGCVLFATHNVLQAERLATRTIFIHQGKEVDSDSEVAQQIKSGKWIG